MREELAAAGYPDYRATDAAVLRLLRRRGSLSITELGTALGISRQAARKLVSGLEQRGYASEARDPADTRSVRVTLTPAGETYAGAVISIIHALNRDLTTRVSAGDLAAADAVLRATLSGPEGRVAERVPLPPPASPPPR